MLGNILYPPSHRVLTAHQIITLVLAYIINPPIRFAHSQSTILLQPSILNPQFPPYLYTSHSTPSPSPSPSSPSPNSQSIHFFTFMTKMNDQNQISESEQLKLIEKLHVFKIKGRDKRGRTIVRIIGKFFPARIVSVDALRKYLEERIFPELERKPFAVLYVHTGVQRCDNFPGISAVRSIYDAIPITVKRNLEAVYFLHPGLQARLFLATFGRFLFTGGVYGKLKYVSRLDYLWEHLRRSEVEVPEFVYDHDEDLEHRPMMDYGLESDHPRVYGAPAVAENSPPVSMYSMRCIS